MNEEQHAQDASKPEGPDMGIAYEVKLRMRRFYKKGVKQNELKMLMEMVTVNEDGKAIGSISSDMNGGFVVNDHVNEEQWHVEPKEIWNQYVEMRKNVVEEDK